MTSETKIKEMRETRHELFQTITSELLDAVVKTHFPLPKKVGFSVKATAEFLIQGNPSVEMPLYTLCYPVLEKMSKFNVEHLRELDFTALLPSIESPNYPNQAFGLILLLGFVPRAIFSIRTTNTRYIVEYFDPIAFKLSMQIAIMSAWERPDRKEFWILQEGYAFEYWVWVRICFYSPIVHVERLDTQDLHLRYTSVLRKEVEKYTGTTDPYESERWQYMDDDKRLIKMLKESFEIRDDIKIQDLFYWYFMILDTHCPIIDSFGRFPYRNDWYGREPTTIMEVTWLEDIGEEFGQLTKTASERIKLDVKNGTWTPMKPKRTKVKPRCRPVARLFCFH